ncbi:hypothetical protein [Actinomadura rugatobispora]|uniref:DUF3168 domain-containing protein n=1 Tax=Actinomadura rugatobispora TaxID=1994 RepID=A0ABW0ZPT2_9ACTN|nr:hypothetical protein GCM10010200_024820 [Actinomadura rugatobispora]
MPSPTPFGEALRALRDHWPDVAGRLDGAARARVLELIGRYRDADPDDRLDVVLELMMLLGEVLPAGHPVRRALAQGDPMMRATALAGDEELWADLDVLFAELAESTSGTGRFDVEAVLREVKARLLRNPTLTEREVRERGQDPAAADLIKLPDPAGVPLLPAFQFGDDGAPRPVVLRVNAMLGAGGDPWGVASWWLDLNARLDEAPFRLLGQVPDEYILAAAAAVIEDAG